MQMALLLLFAFAFAIGGATFIENDYGTQSARALIYNAKWFEILLLFITLNLAYNIFRFNTTCFRRENILKFTCFTANHSCSNCIVGYRVD